MSADDWMEHEYERLDEAEDDGWPKLRGPRHWTTKHGEIIPFRRIEDGHLKNIVQLLARTFYKRAMSKLLVQALVADEQKRRVASLTYMYTMDPHNFADGLIATQSVVQEAVKRGFPVHAWVEESLRKVGLI